MVHSEIYLNKFVVSIAPFSTPACPDFTLTPIQKTALFCMFSLFNFFLPFFRGSADPICPYVRTPMPSIITAVKVTVVVATRGTLCYSAVPAIAVLSVFACHKSVFSGNVWTD